MENCTYLRTLDCYVYFFQKFTSEKDELKEIADYYFDGKGKFFRPMVALLMAKAINCHNKSDGRYKYLFDIVMTYVQSQIVKEKNCSLIIYNL